MRFRQGLTLVLVVSLTGCKVGTNEPQSGSGSGSGAASPVWNATGSPIPVPGLQVVDMVVRADPFQVTTTCPATITFSGRISVAGAAGAVAYRWVRSDRVQGPVQTLKFDRVTKQDVVTTWTLGSPGTTYTGWQAIQIIRPKSQMSERASFTLTCR